MDLSECFARSLSPQKVCFLHRASDRIEHELSHALETQDIIQQAEAQLKAASKQAGFSTSVLTVSCLEHIQRQVHWPCICYRGNQES